MRWRLLLLTVYTAAGLHTGCLKPANIELRSTCPEMVAPRSIVAAAAFSVTATAAVAGLASGRDGFPHHASAISKRFRRIRGRTGRDDHDDHEASFGGSHSSGSHSSGSNDSSRRGGGSSDYDGGGSGSPQNHESPRPYWLGLRAGESEALAEMRELLRDDLRDVPPFPELVGDDRLLRFLRKSGTAAEAASRYRGMLAWRREWRADEVRQHIVSDNLQPDGFPHFEHVQAHIPSDWLRLEASEIRQGRAGQHSSEGTGSDQAECETSLVQYRQRNGHWDTVGIVSMVNKGDELTEEQYLRFWVRRAAPSPQSPASIPEPQRWPLSPARGCTCRPRRRARHALRGYP